MSISKDFEELFEWLLSERVDFVVVGAHAVAVHAKPRYTKDIDVLVRPSPDNAERVLRALEGFGFGGLGLTAEDFTTEGRVIQLGMPPNRVDILTSISGVSFEEAWQGRVLAPYGHHTVPFLGRAELVKNKRAAGRPQDALDVQWLEESDEG